MVYTYATKNISSLIAIVFLSNFIAACGGGGSDSNPISSKPENKCSTDNSGKDGSDHDCDGDNIVNTKPLGLNIAGISTLTYKGDGFGYIDATTEFYFNRQNQLVEQEYLSLDNSGASNRSEKFTQDNKDRLVRREQTRGIDKRSDDIEEWVYNQKDQLIEYNTNTNADGDAVFERTVAYQYNLEGNLEQVVERDPTTTSFIYNSTRIYIYNAQNQLEKINTDEYSDGSIDRVTEIALNANNYLAKSSLYFITTDNVTNNEARELRKTFEYSYDNQGNVIKLIDSLHDDGGVRTVVVN